MDMMFRPKGLKALDKEIERLVVQLGGIEPVDKNYAIVTERLKDLTEARERKNSCEISNEAILTAMVSIVSLLIVLKFEQFDVITSKAFNLISWKRNHN